MKRLADRLLSRSMAFVHDLLMIPLAWLGAYLLRFNLEGVPPWFLHQGSWSLLLVVPLQAGLFWLFGLYRGVWRFASLPDMIRIAKAVVSGAVVVSLALWLVRDFVVVPRSVPVLYAILLMILLAVPRMVYRFIKDQRGRGGRGRRVLIVGAGRAGEMLARDLLRHDRRDYLPVAFVDDDPARQGRDIHGIAVHGPIDRLPELCRRLAVDVVLLAVPSADRRQMQRIVEVAERAGVPVRTLPPLRDLMSGQVRVDQVREVQIDDLLGREPVELDWPAIEAGLAGRRLLVTGAGGSIGSELCRQLARLPLERLVLVDSSEYNLFRIEQALARRAPQLQLEPLLLDIAELGVMERVFQAYRPQVVFHAAAYKHVPLLERHLREAVRNNVLGTRAVAQAAHDHETEVFVLISSDKAVNPANVMGATKRAAERYCQALDAHSATQFITVRFGNVLGSTGSVVPLFQEQIARGGPVTVTHPDMQRYFMTTREACRLIMQAAVLGRGGEIFVLDMGEPVRIQCLAEQMIRLSGRRPGVDIEIRYTGPRPGEKLFEELFHPQEALLPTAHPKILLARHRPALDLDALETLLDRAQDACNRYDCSTLATLLRRLVPEHQGRASGCTLDPAPVTPAASESSTRATPDP